MTDSSARARSSPIFERCAGEGTYGTIGLISRYWGLAVKLSIRDTLLGFLDMCRIARRLDEFQRFHDSRMMKGLKC